MKNQGDDCDRVALVFCVCFAALLAGCGGNGSPAAPPPSITLSLSPATALVYPAQPATAVNVSVTRQGTVGAVSLTVAAPAGVAVETQSPGASSTGSLSFTATTAAAGVYSLTVAATDGKTGASTQLTLTVGAVVQIGKATTGKFNQAMSDTIFPADWNLNFFAQNPTATQIMGTLMPQHILLPTALAGVPQVTASTWDFTTIDAVTQPVLTVSDRSPELRPFPAPAFMYVNGDNTADFLDPTFQQFAGYAQDLVRYYNSGGFTSSDGVSHVSPSYPNTKITWWGIYNEPNVNNNLTPQQYVQMYNALVPAMQAADPSLKFAAMELGMNGDSTGIPQTWVPPFVSGVTARVDALTTHFYSTCDPSRTDAQLFATIPGFVADLQYIYGQLATNPALASVPVWLTENNVDCEASGTSNDPRGSSPFFASWRPYVFSQFGKAGNKALYQFTFNGNSEFGEVDANVATTMYLSYWVDYWLVRMFPSPPGADMLAYASTDTADIEVLPVTNQDGSVTIMIANLAVAGPADSNGAGAPRTVLVDTSALGGLSSASLLIIDRNTNLSTGPVASAITPSPQATVTLSGYGVAFLTLK